MTIAEFEANGSDELDGALLALWWDGRGDWERAHEVAQEVSGADGAWIHAYLHRKEGDLRMRGTGIDGPGGPSGRGI